MSTTNNTDTKAAKKSLRTSISTSLSHLSPQQISSQSLAAQEILLSHPGFLAAKNVSIYLSMPSSEAQTSLLVTTALKEGKKVFVPYLHKPDGEKKRKVMEMLRLASVEEYEGLGRDGWGIPTLDAEGLEGRENALGGLGPSGDEEGGKGREGGLDLVVVPGVAFDAQMRRLGHGAGFYDRYLTRYCEGGRGKPFLVGLCLAEQIVDPGVEIPTSKWDWKVDAVAAGDGRLLTLET